MHEANEMLDTNERLVAEFAGGRRIGYAEYGSPDGSPVLFCHGFPGARLEARHLNAEARAAGIRLIAIDRPGIGATSRSDYGSVAGWVAEALRLASYLELECFGVLGVSGGGPYALALAAELPSIVTHAAVVASPCPLDGDALMTLRRFDRRALVLARRSPKAFRFLVRHTARRGRKPGSGGAGWITSGLDESDQAMARSAAVSDSLHANLAEATRGGTWGLEHEALLYARDWGFDPGTAHCVVDVWHGELDRLVPAAMAMRLAELLPRASLHVVRGEGHLSLLHARKAEILREFAPD